METQESNSIVCSITGGIGTGKSSVAKIVADMGYTVISSDANAKEIMLNNPNVKQSIIAEFGNESYNSDGSINNTYLAKLVFGDSENQEKALDKLNSIVHPIVIQKMIEDVEKLEKAGVELIFVESALTFEAGLDEGFDYIITVDCKEELAIERAMQRSNMTKEEVMLRMKNQMSNQRKTEMADFVIENNGSETELEQSVKFIIGIISQLANN
jgi:dephospho-CoA kinase